MGADQSCCSDRNKIEHVGERQITIEPRQLPATQSSVRAAEMGKPGTSSCWDAFDGSSTIDSASSPRLEHSKMFRPPAVQPDLERRYGPGIVWVMRNEKLIVAGFAAGSVAPKVGVMKGDILKAIEGVDVLKAVPDDEERHPAGNLMVGTYGSYCKLLFARVVNPRAANTHLIDAAIVVPRVVAIPSDDSSNFVQVR